MNKISKNPRHRFDADIVVGRRLRSMRNLLGRSQMDVANAIGITFQQLQNTKRQQSYQCRPPSSTCRRIFLSGCVVLR